MMMAVLLALSSAIYFPIKKAVKECAVWRLGPICFQSSHRYTGSPAAQCNYKNLERRSTKYRLRCAPFVHGT
jgi:hypothetical protein